jgi:ABC-type uncharacterized transport system auxiliary subunit
MLALTCGDCTLSLLQFPVLQATTRSGPTKGSKGAERRIDLEKPEQLRSFERELNSIAYLEEKRPKAKYTREARSLRAKSKTVISTHHVHFISPSLHHQRVE